MDVLCFGEILYDNIEGKSYLGGAPLNFAAHMAKLGARSFIFSKVGTDEQGDKAINTVLSWDVKTKFIQRDNDHSTGAVDVQLKKGSPQYFFHDNVAYDYINLEDFIMDYTVADFDLLYFGTLAQRSETSRSTLLQLLGSVNFPEVFLDINLRQEFYTPEIIHVSLQKATILKLNDEEVHPVSEIIYNKKMRMEELCETLAVDFDLKLIAVTKGSEGCSLFEKSQWIHIPGVEVEVKDTVGAGDAFSAAFMYYYLQDGSAKKAASKANQLGAYVASSNGAVPEYSQELLDILK